MEPLAFTYQTTYPGASMTLFTKEDVGSEDYSLLEDRIGSFSSLYLAFNHHIHPAAHKESKDEIARRENFALERFVLVAAEFNNEGATGYATAFLVSRHRPQVGYVMELSGFQVLHCVYGPWAVKDDDGDLFTMAEVLDYFGLPLEGEMEIEAPAPRVQEEVVAPAFVPNKKRVIKNLGSSIVEEPIEDEEEDDGEPKIIDVPRMSFEAKSNKKPGKIHLDSDLRKKVTPPKPPVQEDEEEEEEAKPVDVARMDFVAGNGKKPGRIHLQSDVKKKTVKRAEEDTVASPVIHTPDFEPAKKAVPGNATVVSYQAKEEITFPLGPKNPSVRLFIYFPDDPYVRKLFDEAAKKLAKRNSLAVNEDCLFTPALPKDESWKKPVSSFAIDCWRILALNVDDHDNPTAHLLGHAGIEGLAMVLDGNAGVAAMGFQGIDVRRPHFGYADLLRAHGISFPKEGE